ncbi:copper chaperone PCu(A)C [Novosphingobium sp. NDB2Meth1]|uniref:copper chaperone PCu(A)C n=1 Tax=Novosphingobium sp. NDB2Meth1 TaxID=1892847 RepID=UPI0009F83C02|nr:copper chaperone PCu(A)C [Novosphingobium sp. NDB2Meth1]
MPPVRSLALASAAAASLMMLSACSGSAPEAGASTAAAPGGAANPAAPDNAPNVSVIEPVIKLPAVPGNPGVLYFTIQQTAGKANTLVAVHVDGAGRAQMHQSKTENGVSTMEPVNAVEFSESQPAEFKAGGYHVMLFDLANTVKPGKDVEVTFTLANGDKVSTFAKVEETGAMEGMMDHM